MLDRHLPKTGDLLGDYRIVGELGRGGLGVVYLAVNQHLFSQRVAIKLLVGPSDLLREAAHLSQLDHPHVVRMVTYGIHRESPYLVLEYLGEQTLHRYLREHGALALADALRINLAVASAIAYLHENDVVHCDIKPQNVVLTERGQPKLIDFGFARSLHSTSSEPFGTETYAAPERARTERSDVFSAAMTLLASLAPTPTGHAPELQVMSKLQIPDQLAVAISRAASARSDAQPSAGEWRAQLEARRRTEAQRPIRQRLLSSGAAVLNGGAIVALSTGLLADEGPRTRAETAILTPAEEPQAHRAEPPSAGEASHPLATPPASPLPEERITAAQASRSRISPPPKAHPKHALESAKTPRPETPKHVPVTVARDDLVISSAVIEAGNTNPRKPNTNPQKPGGPQ